MATSYANPGGTGARANLIAVSGPGTGFYTGPPYALTDGVLGTTFFFTGTAAAGVYLTFDFYDKYVIDEAKWLQDTGSTHGTWQWQGSDDNAAWTAIGAPFTLGGATTQTHASLNGNVTAWRYYRLLGISGTTSAIPWLQECQFRISERMPPGGTLYGNPGGSGNRTGTVTVTTDLALASGATGALVEGTFASTLSLAGGATAGKFIRFDFGAAAIIDECSWYQSQPNTHGVWKWQGSSNGTAWTDIGASLTLGGGDLTSVTGYVSRHRELRGNTAGYQYYRLLGVSGTVSNTPFLLEAEFRIAAGPPALTAEWTVRAAPRVYWDAVADDTLHPRGAWAVVSHPRIAWDDTVTDTTTRWFVESKPKVSWVSGPGTASTECISSDGVVPPPDEPPAESLEQNYVF